MGSKATALHKFTCPEPKLAPYYIYISTGLAHGSGLALGVAGLILIILFNREEEQRVLPLYGFEWKASSITSCDQRVA